MSDLKRGVVTVVEQGSNPDDYESPTAYSGFSLDLRKHNFVKHEALFIRQLCDMADTHNIAIGIMVSQPLGAISMDLVGCVVRLESDGEYVVIKECV